MWGIKLQGDGLTRNGHVVPFGSDDVLDDHLGEFFAGTFAVLGLLTPHSSRGVGRIILSKRKKRKGNFYHCALFHHVMG